MDSLKLFAFILGTSSSIFVVTADTVVGGMQQPLVQIWTADFGQRIVGTSIWYLLAGSGVASAALVLLSPLLGGLMLLAAACGWVALGTALPSGFAFTILMPMALSLLGSIIAIVAAERLPVVQLRVPRLPTREERARERALTIDLEEVELREFEIEHDPEPQASGPGEVNTSVRSWISTLALFNLVLLLLLSLAVAYLYYMHFWG